MVARHGSFDQPFYDGLTCEALIGWYEYTAAQGKHDHRIPPAIKKILDWLWDQAVDKTSGRMAYQVLPVDGYGFSAHLCSQYTSLNNLISPAFAWYWNVTGDDTYRQRGDFLFQHAIDEDKDGFWAGKQFSQNYKASFDYVHYRSSSKPVVSLTDPSNNPPDKSYRPDITPRPFPTSLSRGLAATRRRLPGPRTSSAPLRCVLALPHSIPPVRHSSR